MFSYYVDNTVICTQWYIIKYCPRNIKIYLCLMIALESHPLFRRSSNPRAFLDTRVYSHYLFLSLLTRQMKGQNTLFKRSAGVTGSDGEYDFYIISFSFFRKTG